MSVIQSFSNACARLISCLGEPSFPAQLASELLQLCDAEDTTVLVYEDGKLPSVAYSSPTPQTGASTLDAYVKGPFLLDPYYRKAAYDGEFGVFRLADLAPSGFKESEYYRSWYRNCGFKDECGLLIAIGSGRFVNVALGMLTEGKRFGKKQETLLRDLFPSIEALCVHHWRQRGETTPSIDLRSKLHNGLANFGSSVLTRREQEVTELVLLGNSTRLIAEKLGISSETVKLHRKHAYAKLDVSSQAELFYLFMEALAYSLDTGDTDPLKIYNSKPAKTQP